MNDPKPNMPKNLDELAGMVIRKHDAASESAPKRRFLRGICEKFHERFKTNGKTGILGRNSILLMSSHQPNLFPYSGIMRKISLMEALRIRIEEEYSIPVVTLFEILDNAFPDRWVVEAQLPSISSREGYLGIRNSEIPKRNHSRLTGYGKYPKSINSYPRPSRELIGSWRAKLGEWCNDSLKSILRLSKIQGCDVFISRKKLFGNLRDFLSIASEAYGKSRSYSDFNAYILSKIVNEKWGYKTLFCFSSDMNNFLKEEALSLCSEEYYDALDYAYRVTGTETVKEKLAPFWYHCSCGGKANLIYKGTLSGICLNCKKEYALRPHDIKDSPAGISFRSVPFFIAHSLAFRPEMFVGGAGGLNSYYAHASIVAEKINVELPVITVWNSHDIYNGIGQLDALLHFMENPLDGVHEKVRSLLERSYSIADYAANIGLYETSRQWISYLLGNGDFNADVRLKSFFDSQGIGKFAEQAMLELRNNGGRE